jgi:Flp pilus assembly pilin Flp
LNRELFELSQRQEGQTMVEYAVVLGVITLAILGALAALSGEISTAVNSVVGLV